MIKAHLQPWLDEAFVVLTTTEHRVAQMQSEYTTIETVPPETELTATRLEMMQQMIEEFVVGTSEVQRMLTALHEKISALAK